MTGSSEPDEVGSSAPLDLLDRLARLGCLRDDKLDYAAVRGSVAAEELGQLALEAALSEGIRLTVEVEIASWRADLGGNPGGGVSVSDNGAATEAFGEPQLSMVNRAVEDNDMRALLQQCGGELASVAAEYEHDPKAAGYHWFRTRASLLNLLHLPTRLRAVERLLVGPSVAVVDDLGDVAIDAGGLAIVGRIAAGSAGASNEHLRKPLALAPNRRSLDDDITQSLRRLADEAAWAELATEVAWHPGVLPVVRFEGARVVKVELDVDPTPDQLDETLELWSWATATEEVERREAVQQAVALAILDPRDLAGAARRALPTARSIYNLARRGVVAEALAARRAAREAAASAARSAAEAAGEAASKARDRMLLQVVGAVGVGVARATDVLSPGEALGLLGVLGLVVVGLVGVAIAVDLPAANSRLCGFLEDLDKYSEALDRTDLDDIKSMRSLEAARTDLTRSRQSIAITGGLILLGIVAASLVVA